MRAAASGVLQHEDTAPVARPVFEARVARHEERELELDQRLHGRRERRRAERRQRACHRPHAVRDGAIEAEQLRAAIAEVDRVQVAGQPAVAPAHGARHGEVGDVSGAIRPAASS